MRRADCSPRPPRAHNGYRRYGEGAAAILHFVDQAQRLGFSLAEIKEGMPDPRAALPSSSTIVVALLQKEAEIDRLIEAAKAKKKAIAALLDELRCAA